MHKKQRTAAPVPLRPDSLAPLEPTTHARDSGVAVAMSTRERLAHPPPTPTPPSEPTTFQCCRATQQTTQVRTCRWLCQKATDPAHPRSLTAPPDSPASLLLSADIASPIQGAGCYRAHLPVEIPLTTHARGRALARRSPSFGRPPNPTRRHQAPTLRDQMLCPPAHERRGKGDERPTAVQGEAHTGPWRAQYSTTRPPPSPRRLSCSPPTPHSAGPSRVATLAVRGLT